MRFFSIFLTFCAVSCSVGHSDDRSGDPKKPPAQTAEIPVDQLVVIATASFRVDVGRLALAATYPVTVVLAQNAALAIDTTAFAAPTMDNSVLSFGSIKVTNASTNHLKACGTGGNQRCTKALLRVYTSGVAGTGFWNTMDGYGAPMDAGLSGSLQVVGLGPSAAIVTEQITIPGNRNTVKITDFSPTPVFLFQGDFSDAGDGSYSTTINIDLALAP
jgi:hypothetical protein